MHELVVVPCLQDNFAYLLHDPVTGGTACIDVPEVAPIMAALQDRGWKLSHILLTHHHDDHVQGVDGLRATTGAKLLGAAADAHRLPPLDQPLHPGDLVTIGALEGVVIDVPGHTIGHIAFHFPDAGIVFTADSLMGLGCGRLFEGSPAQMWDSLSRLAALPPDTLVCSGHDYGRGNAAFALSVDAGNADLRARADQIAAGHVCVPAPLSVELATNPFLRAADPALARAAGTDGSDPAATFAALRAMKDRF
ncbi:hydroxyacylglutathione hydrolase [Paracoccus sp. p4-l81]|uniref:hydroxyacylglutathione hydrolase n=1 Tax=unclassified Paracoccus (in: a-proteobacteria) TaxID=2688777 RepID=UPI0035BAC65C